MQDEGFITVTSKRRTKRRNFVVDQERVFQEDLENFTICPEVASRRLEAAKLDLQTSDYYSSVLAVLREALSLIGASAIEEILCYGLGQFSECMISRYQCALLILLQENFNAKVLVHDPVFGVSECKLLGNFGFEVITENEEGCRKLSGKVTLVFLPHCPRQLTDNFLRTNWSSDALSKCLLFSNSLAHLTESGSKIGELSKDCPCSVALFPYSVELGLVNCFRYVEIFNDLALHVFPAPKLSVASQDLWYFRPPNYCKKDIEFISKEEKSHIFG
ncbi:hypothetical protein J437_LFUL017444 [Ladona fulva]|uniref:SRR1-like domain-containing protein n=1 Tax=Ladona fulva TaxID=123851 RepID=A0A8K0P875_LADFU|nr:hypothetical protein J437_LFUL017444 [Ladona fulva]